MAKINRAVIIDGQKKWIRADSEQEYAEKLLSLASPKTSALVMFEPYAEEWYKIYAKDTLATVTAATYRRQLDKYLIPAFREKAIQDITVKDIQAVFNSMQNVTKATKNKVRQVLSIILDLALKDDIIKKNPVKSKKLKITSKASKPTELYTVEQMKYLIRNSAKLSLEQDRRLLLLLTLSPLRLEEALGLKWQDIDEDNNTLYIRRAVTHPARNQPEIKDTKTAGSIRTLSIPQPLAEVLADRGKDDEFVIGGAKPLSYTQVRHTCERIKRDTGFTESITPRRFRTTVLSDIYANSKDIKLTQAMAGHTTSAMTLKYYVKGRKSKEKAANVIESVYCR